MRLFEKVNQKLGTGYKIDSEINWEDISEYQKLSEDFIREFQDKVDWWYISHNQKLSENFIKEFQDRMYWDFISKYQKLSEDFIREFQDKVNWWCISTYQKLSEDFIREFQDKVTWISISIYQKLSEPFIKEFKDKVNWNWISVNQSLSEDFIKEFANEISWGYISKYQKLSEDFIKEHQYNFGWCGWNNISRYQKLSKEFIEEFKDKLDMPLIEDNWIYKTAEEKKQELINTGKYECYDDYFIAYKAIRSDRYSLFNFQYQYLPDCEYESWCDCSNNDGSFGLSVGTYDYCENYLDDRRGIIVRCKVKYEDIGRIVYDGEKIRCFKIRIME